MGKLDGKIAIITGAARGLGAAYAKAFAAEGAQVCVSDVLDPSATVTAIESDGGKAIGVTADVTDISACENLVTQTAEAFGGVDILVNNAALFVDIPRRTFLDIDSDEWDKVMAVNVRGPWLCAKAAVPEMRKNGYGKIVNIASGTLFKGVPDILHYVTSKGAVLAMTRSMSREVGGDGICVNTLAPGLTMSEGVLGSDEFMSGRDANLASRALKRYQEPEDLTGAMLFLVSSDSDFMTGQCMVVDGGSVNN